MKAKCYFQKADGGLRVSFCKIVQRVGGALYELTIMGSRMSRWVVIMTYISASNRLGADHHMHVCKQYTLWHIDVCISKRLNETVLVQLAEVDMSAFSSKHVDTIDNRVGSMAYSHSM